MTKFVLTLLTLLPAVAMAAEWSYKYTGADAPNNWPNRYSKFCSGRRQSPINIVQTEAVKDDSLRPYSISMPNVTGRTYWLGNYGNKLNFDFKNLPMNVSFGGSSCFRPLSMHWHWGSDSSRGSEHRREGRQSPMEGHIVMWNCEFYDTFDSSFGEVDGIAVLGVMYEESSASTSLTDGFSKVVDAVRSDNISFCLQCNSTGVTGSISSGVEIDAFDISQLLPTDLSKYFMYFGSLTTPACMEGLVWTVYETKVQVPTSVLAAFRAVRFSDGEFMSNIYRPVQQLNPDSPIGPRRVVTRSFDIPVQPSAASTTRVVEIGVFATAAASFLARGFYF